MIRKNLKKKVICEQFVFEFCECERENNERVLVLLGNIVEYVLYVFVKCAGSSRYFKCKSKS